MRKSASTDFLAQEFTIESQVHLNQNVHKRINFDKQIIKFVMRLPKIALETIAMNEHKRTISKMR